MKVTIVHTNNKKQLLVSTKTMEKLLQRIAKDDSRLTVTHFREYVTYMESGYEYYKAYPCSISSRFPYRSRIRGNG